MTRNKPKPIRFGIIGSGLMARELASAMARWCHLLDLDVRPELVAICGRNLQRLDWFTANFPTLGQTTADYRELLANPAVDAVYCAVPHNLHRQMYIDIIEAGKHLLGEKPFGIDREANRAILDAAARHPQTVVRAASEFPFFPAAQRIVRFIKENRFGRILEVDCGFMHSSDLNPDKPINWKRMIDINGEYGCMGNLGPHVFHVPLRAGWRPANVRAILSKVVRERPDASGRRVPCETWDNAALLCEVVQADGYTFPLTAKMQRIAPGEFNTWYLTIKGTEFSARFSTKRPNTLETMPYSRSKPQAWHSEDVGYETQFKTITGGIFEFGFSDSLLQMLAAFCRQIELGNGGELFFGCETTEETRWTHEIFTAALASQKTMSVVAIGP